MTERLDFYRCKVCGNLVQVILPGVGELVCCGQPMEMLIPQTSDNTSLNEHHIPIFADKGENGEEIRVGTQLHPMTNDHYIHPAILNRKAFG